MKRTAIAGFLLILTMSLFACSGTGSGTVWKVDDDKSPIEGDVSKEGKSLIEYKKVHTKYDLTSVVDGSLLLFDDISLLMEKYNPILAKPVIAEHDFIAGYAAFLYVQSGRANTLIFPKTLLQNQERTVAEIDSLSDPLGIHVRKWTEDIDYMTISMIDVATAYDPDFPMIVGAESKLVSISSLFLPFGNDYKQQFLIKNHLISHIPSEDGRMFSLEVNASIYKYSLSSEVPVSFTQSIKSEKQAHLIAWDANGPQERVLPLSASEHKMKDSNAVSYRNFQQKWSADDGTIVKIDVSRANDSYAVSLIQDIGLKNAGIELYMAAVFNVEDPTVPAVDIVSDTFVGYSPKAILKLPSTLRIPLG